MLKQLIKYLQIVALIVLLPLYKLMAQVGIGTTSPVTELQIYSPNESTTLTNFTQALSNGGLLVQTDYTANAYTPGVFWSTSDNNSTKPKAGIFLRETGTGSFIHFGTSSSYATGITSSSVVIDPSGNFGIGADSPGSKLHINASDPILQIQNSDASNISNTITYDVKMKTTTQDRLYFRTLVTSIVAADATRTSQVDLMTNDIGSFGAAMTLNGHDLGVGTTTPDVRVSIVPKTNGDEGLRVCGLGVSGGVLGQSIIGMHQWEDNASARSFASVWLEAAEESNADFDADFHISTRNSNADVAPTRRFTVEADGDVGIGTTSPNNKLQIVGGTDVNLGNNGYLVMGSSTGLNIGIDENEIMARNNGGESALNLQAEGGDIVIRGGQTGTQIYFLDNGNSGFGTPTPSAKLHVSGSVRLASNGEAANRILVSDATGVATWQDASAVNTNSWQLDGNSGTTPGTDFVGTTDAQNLVLKTAGNERVNIGDAANEAGMVVKAIAGQTANWFEVQNSAGTIFARINANGEFSNPTQSSGANNEAFGRDALKNITTPIGNTAFGYSTLSNNTTGGSNTAVGDRALAANITSNSNTAVGALALNRYNTADGGNTAIGNFSLWFATSSNSNTAVGYNTFGSTSNGGAFNVAMGNGAMSTANAKGNHNVVLGNSAFLGGSGSNNVVIGSKAADAQGAGDNNIIIGYDNDAVSSTGSNQLDIGDVIYGDLSTGRIGIGTATPAGQFELSLDQGRKPSTNTWTITSDERLKTIHGPYKKGLNELMQLKAVKYNYKNVGKKTFAPEVLETEAIGFSAQEVQKVFPEAVGRDQDGYLNLNTHAILIAYLNAIKELKTQNEKQQEVIVSLKDKMERQNEKLQKQIEELRASKKMVTVE